MQTIDLFLFCCIFCCIGATANAAPLSNDPDAIQAAYDRGEYLAVVETLDRSLVDDSPTIHSSQQIRWLLLHADAYRRLGKNQQANKLILSVRRDIERLPNQDEALALYYGQVAESHLFERDYDRAASAARYGLEIASRLHQEAVVSALQNTLGNVFTGQEDYRAAMVSYTNALNAAERAGSEALTATSAINLSRASLAAGEITALRVTLDQARAAAAEMPLNAERLVHQLSLGQLYLSAQQSLGYSGEYRTAAYEQLRGSLQLSVDLDDRRSMSFALGYLSELYSQEQRWQDAMELANRAVDSAYLAGADDALYRWEWELARLYVHDGSVEQAAAAYRRAIRSSDRIRASSGAGLPQAVSLRQLYYEAADLFLRRTTTLTDRTDIQAGLLEVRETLEGLKTAEIVDYFDNECLVQVQDKSSVEELSDTAVIIYPVLLPDRTELLVSLPGEILQLKVPVHPDEMTRTVREFRLALEDAGSGSRFLAPSQRLYDWIIRPLEPRLRSAKVETLVFVPDGPLRTIPMSALHDGRQFLIEKYAIATTPGISLTSTRSDSGVTSRVLANGITDAVQGFSALPNVAQELSTIEQLYPTRVNQNQKFELASVDRSMAEGEYSIVHIATHGQFDRDHHNSFLLTYDDRITMNRLEESLNLRRYQEKAIDLLVLSACQTAAGDDRAALGMAGVALKAGAGSALATLWFINDASTSALMGDFYRNLRTGRMTKAQALQSAQIEMIARPGYQHPAHWAPFLLIGNWL